MSWLRKLRRDIRGATIVEFALVLTPLMTLVMGGIEAGHMAHVRSVIEGSLRVAARMATTGRYTSTEIDAYVRGEMRSIGVPEQAVEITRKSYSSFESVAKPEPLTSDVAPVGGTPGKGDCYIDLNGDNQWSADAGSNGDGQSEDILYYGVTINYQLLFAPVAKAFGGADGYVKLKANTVVKNEPFGDARTPPVERCIA